jgi:hypothetical protein
MQPERSTPRLRRFEVVSGLPLVLASFFFAVPTFVSHRFVGSSVSH